MRKLCQVCGEAFQNGDKLAAVMLSEFKEIDSDVHFAIKQPTVCREIFHIDCYDDYDRFEDSGIETYH